MTVITPAPRRSGRERRKVQSVYDEAREKASGGKIVESEERLVSFDDALLLYFVDDMLLFVNQ